VRFIGAAPVLPCANIDAALSYFTDVLGFEVDFVYGDYAAVERDHVELHLRVDAVSPARVAIVIDQADAYHDQIVARGARIEVAPGDRPYGMRDFNVRTPDGHVLVFGQSIAS
jgi:catechol 2,3-dioxygenase-like lactoylglutathione lyase family enzyme